MDAFSDSFINSDVDAVKAIIRTINIRLKFKIYTNVTVILLKLKVIKYLVPR